MLRWEASVRMTLEEHRPDRTGTRPETEPYRGGGQSPDLYGLADEG